MPKQKQTLFLRQNYQVIYGVILILLIPLAIILNTISSIGSFQQNMDIGLQRQALSLGQLFDATVYKDAEDFTELQNKIDAISAANSSLSNFDILVSEGEDFKVVASLDPEQIDRVKGDLNYVIAWHQNEAVATLVSGVVATGSDERFWEVVMPLHEQDGEKSALLSLRMSLQIMDTVAKDTLTKSYIILAITVVIVILLLALNTRLFEHAILFLNCRILSLTSPILRYSFLE